MWRKTVMADELHDSLLKFTDDAMAKMVELEQTAIYQQSEIDDLKGVINTLNARVDTIEKQLSEILGGHEGSTRDDLKVRIEKLEGKLHTHFEAVKKAQQLGGQATA